MADAPLELVLLILSLVLLVTIAAGTLSSRFGVPALIGFLALGMAMGVDGPGGISFDDFGFSQVVGSVCLIFILFSGGLDTVWKTVRGAVPPALVLATLGVLVSAGIMGVAASWLLDFSPMQGFLLGAVVASTDAAAVFAVLRSGAVALPTRVEGLIEFESGSNDPMAIFLVGAATLLLSQPGSGIAPLVPDFAVQMVLGALFGAAIGWCFPRFLKRVHARFAGLGLVVSIASALLAFGLAEVVGGNGFLSAYVAGLVAGNQSFAARRAVSAFQDGVAWLAQVVMFLTLGLLATPTQLLAIAPTGLALAAILMFVARPVSVFLCLAPFRYDWREKLLIAWAGLRGAVPIVLATFPIVAGVAGAFTIFNTIFFVVVLSSLIQGPTLNLVASRLLPRPADVGA